MKAESSKDSQSCQTVKYGHETCRTQNQEITALAKASSNLVVILRAIMDGNKKSLYY
jgi:hypothetical protein